MAGRNRKRIPLVVGGGMNRAGDPKKIAPQETRDCYNMLVRPGPRVEKRSGWLGESVASVMEKAFRYVADSGSLERIGFSSSANIYGGQLKIGGVWTNIATDAVNTMLGKPGVDYVNMEGKVYLIYSPPTTGTLGGAIVSYNGTAFDYNPFLLVGAGITAGLGASFLSGRAAESFVNRLFIGHPATVHANEIYTSTAYNFGGGAAWTKAGGMTAAIAGTVHTLTVGNGTTDTARTTAAAFESRPTASLWYTVTFDVRGIDAVASVPLTMTLENAAATTIYKTFEFEVPSRTVTPEWTTYTFQTQLPATTEIYVKYKAGNTSVATSPLKSFDVADFQVAGPLARGIQVTVGRYAYQYRTVDPAAQLIRDDAHPNRVIWCEADDPTEWRAANYIDLTESPGPVRVIRKGSGRLMVYKDNAIWVYRGVANPDLPLQRERVLQNIGCGQPRAIDRFEDHHFFIDAIRGEVYRWDISGEPVPLCGDRMREYMFAASGLVTTPVLQVDSDNREVWVYTQTGVVFVYNLVLQSWTRHDIRTVGGTAATINDLIYMKAESETRRAMWASINGTPAQVVKLTVGQTQDVVQGTTTSPTASYEFHPMAQHATDDVTVESLAIDHQITGSQTGSTTKASVSRDGGATFPDAITVTLAPLATAGVSKRMQVPVWQTSQDVVVKVEHTGLAGPEYFNFTGGDTTVNSRGRGTQKTNPTPVSSTL